MQSICLTDFGRFKIQVDNKNINVGGSKFCVNLALYSDNTVSLYYLKTDELRSSSTAPTGRMTDEGGCELNDKEIRGDNTIKMTDLAFSLLKKFYPERDGPVTLLDDSGFSWKGPRSKTYKTNFLKGYLLIHRKTWYEDKFNATMCDKNIYRAYREKADKNFDDPSKKPAVFNFINEEATAKLKPLYDESKTWGEFINKFIAAYDNTKYMLMYDWYRNAIYHIFDGMEINQNWEINITPRPTIECIPQKVGSGKRTRKNRRITFSKYNRLEPYSFNPF